MRLSYHGWAATLLLLAFLLVVGGAVMGGVSTSIDTADGHTISCGSPWIPGIAAVTTQCAATFGMRGPIGLALVLFGVVLFGGQLLVGMAVAGVRDALANRPEQASTPPAN